jgi:hypothetical protein
LKSGRLSQAVKLLTDEGCGTTAVALALLAWKKPMPPEAITANTKMLFFMFDDPDLRRLTLFGKPDLSEMG